MQDADGTEKGGVSLSDARLDLNGACERSVAIVSRTPEIEVLYRQAVKSIGSGELKNRILDLAAQAIMNEQAGDDVTVNDESLLSLFCGIWLQFLLVEIGGYGREELRSLALKILADMEDRRTLH